MAIPSPCIQQCALNEASICLGCGRHVDEVTQWVSMSKKQRTEATLKAKKRLSELKKK